MRDSSASISASIASNDAQFCHAPCAACLNADLDDLVRGNHKKQQDENHCACATSPGKRSVQGSSPTRFAEKGMQLVIGMDAGVPISRDPQQWDLQSHPCGMVHSSFRKHECPMGEAGCGECECHSTARLQTHAPPGCRLQRILALPPSMSFPAVAANLVP